MGHASSGLEMSIAETSEGEGPGRTGGRSQDPRRTRWLKAFEACDEDNKGYLNREDYKVAVVMLFGYKPSKTEVDSVMASVKQNQSGISQEDFLNLMSTKKDIYLYHCKARQIFTAFDRQCKGFLSLEDFKKAFSIVAPKLPERVIVEAFRYGPMLTLGTGGPSWKHFCRAPGSQPREVDQDSDGHISFKEFESAVNYGQENLSAHPFA